MTETTAAQPRIAWAIHIFTASGILAGFFGLLSALDGSPRASLLWMMVAMIIDGLDGPIARKYDVSTVLPMIDGHVMDLVIDYVTCVVAPAFFIHEFHLLPAKFDIVGTGLILLTSLYLFSYTHIQTEDCYFNGFPAMWNLVVNILFVTQSRPVVNAVVVVLLSVLTIVPLKFTHPIRVRDFRKITIPVLVIWIGAMIYLTWILDDRLAGCTESCLPIGARAAQGIVYLGTIWIVGVGVWRTFAGRRDTHTRAATA
jgi:phosphatidylcholine synthase